MLGNIYLGNKIIDNFLSVTIKITAFTNVFLPLLVLILSIMFGELKRGERALAD